MTQDLSSSNPIPHWYLTALQVIQDANRSVRDVDSVLRHAMALEDIDPRLRTEMQYVRDALGAVKVSLSVMDLRAETVLRELAGTEAYELGRAAVR